MQRRESPYGHGRSEIWERRGHASLLRRERQVLADNVRALRSLRGWTQVMTAEAAGLHPVHISRIELGTANVALPALVALALAFAVRVQMLFRERVVGESSEKPFEIVDQGSEGAIPLYDLAAAAGAFAAGRAVEALSFVRPHGVLSKEGMFVARVKGRSMEPLVPHGSYGVFAPIGRRSPAGRVVLVQHHGAEDPDTGGSYSVKRVQFVGGAKRRVRLISENSNYPDLVLDARSEEYRVIAELMVVLG